LDIALRLSLQRALLCEVSPNLRMVGIDWDDKNNTIFIYFYFDNMISDENRDSTNSIAAEVGGDFDETQVVEKCIQLDFPLKLPKHTYTIYRRKE
jgi:hypothetical protein